MLNSHWYRKRETEGETERERESFANSTQVRRIVLLLCRSIQREYLLLLLLLSNNNVKLQSVT